MSESGTGFWVLGNPIPATSNQHLVAGFMPFL